MKGRKFRADEVASIYVSDEDRFVVSLIVGYGGSEDGMKSPYVAASAALQLTRDEGSEGTFWFVFDRKTGQMYEFEQGDFEETPIP